MFAEEMAAKCRRLLAQENDRYKPRPPQPPIVEKKAERRRREPSPSLLDELFEGL